MNHGIIAVAVSAALSLSCGGGPSPEAAATPLSPSDRLAAILATDITRAQDSLYTRFAAEQGANMKILLPALALDASAPALARANAVLRMGQLFLPRYDVYRQTIEDPDPRVRGATLGVVGPLATRDPQQTIPILARGLRDPEAGIQAKALQELRDRDLELLRFYISSGASSELRGIALETLRTAYAWGAPVTPEPDGTLRRVSPSGVGLELRPDTVWSEWEALSGTLMVTHPSAGSRVLADSVEAVAAIIPAVVDASGRYVALETARRIEVHDLESGSTRVIGPGSAPRPLPFTTDFLYFREIARTIIAQGTTLRYEVLRAPFQGGEPVAFDTVEVAARPDRHGYLSPVRWLRVHDRGTSFVLHTDGLRNHPLPTPIGPLNGIDDSR